MLYWPNHVWYCRFLPALLTAVLTNHLAWVPTVMPNGQPPIKIFLEKHSSKSVDMLAKTHPYNPLWAQLGEAVKHKCIHKEWVGRTIVFSQSTWVAGEGIDPNLLLLIIKAQRQIRTRLSSLSPLCNSFKSWICIRYLCNSRSNHLCSSMKVTISGVMQFSN